MAKLSEHLELLKTIDPDGDFENLTPVYDEMYDGHIHSVTERSTGKYYLSQGQTTNAQGTTVAIYLHELNRHEELKPGEYDILKILQWNKETESLEIVPYIEEQ